MVPPQNCDSEKWNGALPESIIHSITYYFINYCISSILKNWININFKYFISPNQLLRDIINEVSNVEMLTLEKLRSTFRWIYICTSNT